LFQTYHPALDLDGTASAWIALAALIVAFASARYTRQSVRMASREHVEFLKRLQARARLRVDLSAVSANLAPDDENPLAIMAPPGQAFQQILQLGVRNEGDGAAGPTTINVLVPANVRGLEWSNSVGVISPDSHPARDTGEQVRRHDGTMVPALWIDKEIRRVSTRTPVLLYFKLVVDRNDQRLPIRIKAQCDELPDDVFEECRDFELLIHDDKPPYQPRTPVV
jgi:hypothetical protein